MKQTKQCQHLNTVQVGSDNEIRTFCKDCNEVVKYQLFAKGKAVHESVYLGYVEK